MPWMTWCGAFARIISSKKTKIPLNFLNGFSLSEQIEFVPFRKKKEFSNEPIFHYWNFHDLPRLLFSRQVFTNTIFFQGNFLQKTCSHFRIVFFSFIIQLLTKLYPVVTAHISITIILWKKIQFISFYSVDVHF